MRYLPLLLLSLSSVFTGTASSDTIKPKYGPEATRIFLSHEYFTKNPAPDYWALSPYYVGQRDGKSCSLASVTMVVNAARAAKPLTADDELAEQNAVLKKTADPAWEKDLGTLGMGVKLDELGHFVDEALRAYGVIPVKVEVIHADKNSGDFRKRLHELLLENEKSDRNFIIANFLQGAYTGDAAVGHIAPVGAFDAKKKQVLIMDPDRQWYEPYWISEEIFVEGMSTNDKVSGKNRGLVWVQLPPNTP